MAAIRVVGSVRDWINARDVRRMVRRQTFPEALVRHYIDLAEYGRDEAALQGIGYVAVGKDVTPSHVGVTIPASTNGLSGHLDRRVQRRVASIHILYRRRPAPAAQTTEPEAHATH
jgi:hypothetical protein